MATVTTFVDKDVAHEVLEGNRGVKVVEIDFSQTNASAADVVQIAKVSAGTLVEKVDYRVKTAEGGTATADIGDGDDPNGYDDAINLNAAANTVAGTLPVVATDAYAKGKYYAADDTIDLTLDHNLDAAVVVFYVHYITDAFA